MISRNKDMGILITRLSIGVLMLFHGIAKVSGGVSPIENMLSKNGLPAFIAYGVFIGEIVAPIAIIIGFRARLASLIFIVNCVVAMLLAHGSDIFSLSKHGGWSVELLGLYTFGALSVYFTGAGAISVSKSNKWD